MKQEWRNRLLLTISFLCFSLAWLPANAQCDFAVVPSAAESAAQSPLGFHGATIVRVQNTVFFTYRDISRGLSVVHGVADPAAWCESGDWSMVDLADWQMVLLPDEVQTLTLIGHGDDIGTTVWPLVELPPDVPESDRMCYVALNYEPLATGTADIVFTSSDWLWAWYHQRTGTEHASAHGILTSGSGDRIVLNSHKQCTWRWTSGEFCGKCVSQINMH